MKSIKTTLAANFIEMVNEEITGRIEQLHPGDNLAVNFKIVRGNSEYECEGLLYTFDAELLDIVEPLLALPQNKRDAVAEVLRSAPSEFPWY